jgi:hypothetical protein
VRAIAEGSDGALWFGTSGGASRFFNNSWTTFVSPVFESVAVATDDTVWVGGPDGAWHFDRSVWTAYTVADGLVGNYVQAIATAPDGALWFGTSSGVSRFDGGIWTTYTTTHGLASDDVQAIAAAPDGALWFGTYGDGVSRFEGGIWTTYTTTDGLASDYVNAIAAAADGQVWVGTSRGASRFDGGAWTTFTSADGLARDYVGDIAVTADGQVWASTGSYTFSVFDGTVWTVLTWSNSPLTGGNDLCQDQTGNVWYVYGSYLKGYDGLKEYAFSHPQDVSFYDLALDSQGSKWVVDRKGLWSYDGTLPALKQGTHVISDTSFPSAWNAGMRYVQIPIRWAELEPAQGEYDFGFLHYLHRKNWRFNLHHVLRIFAPPAWARATGSTETGPPNDPQVLEDLMRALVVEFGSSFTYVIWNEPNLPGEWGGGTPNAADYVALLHAAYQGAKSADPRARVISAGLAPTEGGGGAVRDIDFLTQMYDAGLANYADAVGMNGLGFAYGPDDTSDPNGYNFSRLADLRQVMVDKGDGDKKAWLLEVGWMRDSDVDLGGYNWYKVSERQQAAYLARAMDKVRIEWPWVEAMFLWNLDYDRFLPDWDQMYWFSYGQRLGYLAVAPIWRPYFHNQCGVTNQTRPVLRGSAPPRSAGNVYLDGAPLLATTATYSSTFATALTTDLSAGAHVFTAVFTSPHPLYGGSGVSSAPLALTVDPSLPYDPLGVSFAYRHPGSGWTGLRVPKNGDGCAVPDDWSVSLVPGVATTVTVPVSCAGSASVDFSYGSITVSLSDSGSGVYQGTFTPAGDETLFTIEVSCGGDTTTGSGTLFIVPDGVVYDAAKGTDSPLEGVSVTIERTEYILGIWTLWDAWNYPVQGLTQENPQKTGVDGHYSFTVPPGGYLVTAVKKGYLSASYHIWVWDMPVHLNIALGQPKGLVYLPLILGDAPPSASSADR